MKTEFIAGLTEAYLENPCQVLPNPLWKTLRLLDSMSTEIQEDEYGICRIFIYNPTWLHCFWRRNRAGASFNPAEFSAQANWLLHEDYAGSLGKIFLDQASKYFRLVYPTGSNPAPGPAFHFENVALERESGQVAEFIRRCYPGSKMDAVTVERWQTHRVYDPLLWFWVVGEQGERLGLGIGEWDPENGEGALEWIQVLPQFRKRGVGGAIVLELTRRLLDRCSLVTVSGQMDSAFNLEQLYRRCGFVGEDIWWVIRRGEV